MQQLPLNQSLQIELDKIPSMPYALLQLLEVIRDPDVCFTEISEIIQSDPALTTRVMSMANSGAFYQWSQNKDFNRLLVTLGLKMVKSIAINSAVQQFFSQFNVDNEGLLAQFWQTSLTTAAIAKALAHMTGYQYEDEAYIAGLLHLSGELICLMHNTDAYIKLKAKQTVSRKSGTETNSLQEWESRREANERDFIGATIPEIGALIVRGFDQNSMLADAILYQRESAEQMVGAPHLVQIINLAHKLSLLNKQSLSDDLDHKDLIFEEVFRVFNLNQPLLEEMLTKSHSEFLDTAKKMGLKINDDQSIEIDNEKVQMALADNVRTIALSSSLQQMNDCRLEGRSEQDLIAQIMQNLKILFGLSNSVYFSLDEEAGQLKLLPVINFSATNDELSQQAKLLAQLDIPLEADMTLPVQALLKGVPVTSDRHSSNKIEKESVLDRQILRLMGAEEMLCIPLLDKINNKKYGVLVAGISAGQKQKIQCEKGLLYEFSKAASEVISQDRRMSEQLKAVVEEEQSMQSMQIKKLVHEANNPLGVIRNYLQVLSVKLADSDDPKLQGQLDILMSEVERVGEIVLRIRDTPNKTVNNSNKVDINLLITQLLSIFKESLFVKSGIVANIKCDPSIPLIKSNANSLKQILTNLFKNATEAMPDGGKITISTRDQVNFNGEQFIELRVFDSGPGIPEEILNNLFNPVKSTKSGEHSGLGLSIIKNLVNDLGGTIGGSNRCSVQHDSDSMSQENTGAEFIILLPRTLS